MHNLFVILVVLGLLVGSIAAVILLDRLLLWMEAKEWIYWRKRKPKGGGGISAALTAMHQLVQPEVRQVIEERSQRSAADVAEQGAPAGPTREGEASAEPPS